jgi:hypothetical protein
MKESERESGVFCKKAKSKKFCPIHGKFPSEWKVNHQYVGKRPGSYEYGRIRNTGCFRVETDIVKMKQDSTTAGDGK